MGLNIQDLAMASPDFADGGRLDDRHTAEEGNVAPRLTVSGVPDGTVELAIVCHDPDAPLPDGFTHWTVYGIPADTSEVGPDADDTYRTGPNDTGQSGYFGPAPPPGHGDHRYYFWVYALSRPVQGEPSRRDFIDGYGQAIIEQNRVVGVYPR